MLNNFPNNNKSNDENKDLNGSKSKATNSILKSNDSEDNNNVTYDESIIKLIVRRKNQLIGAFLLVFMVMSGLTIYKRIVSPEYESSFQLLVSDPTQDDSGRSSSGSNTASQFLGLSNRVDVATLISVLKSRSILEPVVKEFSKSLPAGSREQKDFDYSWESFLEGKSYKLPIEVLQERGARYQDVNVLKITYQGYDPKIAKAFLEQLSQVYIKYSIFQKRQRITKGISFLNQEYPLLKKKLDTLESKIKGFRQKYKLIDPLEQARFILSQINTTDNILNSLATQLLSKQKVLETISSQYKIDLNSQLDNELSSSTRYQSLLNNILKLKQQLVEAKAEYTEENPEIITLVEKKEAVENLLNQEAAKIVRNKLSQNQINYLGNKSAKNQEIYNQYQNYYLEYITLKTEKQSLQKILEQLQKQYQVLPELSRRYSSLFREYDVANKNYLTFIDARERLRLDLAQRITSWEIVAEPALNTEPISPNLLLNFAVAVATSLGFALIYAYIYDKYDNVFHSTKEVQDIFNIPILSEIPYNQAIQNIKEVKKSSVLQYLNVNKSENRKKSDREIAFYHECFSTLYSNLEFFNIDTKLKSIAITSTIPGEGKSTISISLAKRMSEFGKKVLLVDADMRRPQVHLRLNLPNFQGLSNLLVNDLEFTQVIQPISDNLYVLTSGQIPPDPSLLLSSQRMKKLITELYSQFDCIIYDTPPLLGIPDTYFLAPALDSLLWVVSMGKVDRHTAIQVFNAIKFRKLNLSGCITNILNSSYNQASSSGYASYYTYYAQTQDKTSKKSDELDKINNNILK